MYSSPRGPDYATELQFGTVFHSIVSDSLSGLAYNFAPFAHAFIRLSGQPSGGGAKMLKSALI